MSCLILGWLTPGGKSLRDSHPLVLINSEEGVGYNLHFLGAGLGIGNRELYSVFRRTVLHRNIKRDPVYLLSLSE